MNFSARCIAFFIFLVCVTSQLVAQLPTSTSVQLYLEDNGVPYAGWYDVTVSWYTSVAGGTPIHEETFSTLVTAGVATLEVGSNQPLSTQLLSQAPLWIGARVNGGVELTPRIPVLTVPYAMIADRALVAERLAPEVTGVVTSVNEIAGAVELRAGSGIRITRDKKELSVHATSQTESGVIPGERGVFQYSVTPLTLLAPNTRVNADVDAQTSIAVRVDSIDVTTNSILFVTSAPLLDTEFIRWQIQP